MNILSTELKGAKIYDYKRPGPSTVFNSSYHAETKRRVVNYSAEKGKLLKG